MNRFGQLLLGTADEAPAVGQALALGFSRRSMMFM